VRRLALLALAVLASAAAGIAGCGEERSGYRVDAIFDTASGVIPGQEVRIAGARAGVIEDVRLTADHRARVQMRVDERFAPFRADADCMIQPQALIGEKFVQCVPGTPRAGGLGGQVPTVPVERTSAPVDVDMVVASLRMPVRQRASLLISALGAGLAARGGDLNAAIRRASPALRETRRLLRVVGDQRDTLRSLVAASDRVIARLAARKGRVRDFIAQADRTAARVARRSGPLAAGVRDLPATLDEARPALERLDAFAASATPLLADLRTAAPVLDDLVGEVPALAAAGRPALDALGRTARAGRPVLRDAAPVVRALRDFVRAALPTGRMVDDLFVSLRDRGVVEGLLTFNYLAAATTARFDSRSHMLPAYPILNECMQYATAPDPDCDAHYGGESPSGRSTVPEHLVDYLLEP